VRQSAGIQTSDLCHHRSQKNKWNVIMQHKKITIISIALLISTLSFAQTPTPCSSPQYRQFDFWVGEWEVTTVGAEGESQLAGHNTIQALYNGCTLHEKWRSAGASRGESFNSYDASRDVWHQTWVDNQGTLLTLEGGLKGDAMVLAGEGPAIGNDPDIKRAQHRITWQPNEDGSVTQTWDTGGPGNWQTIFQGLYQRKKDSQ